MCRRGEVVGLRKRWVGLKVDILNKRGCPNGEGFGWLMLMRSRPPPPLGRVWVLL
jgi:hypothetical protein